MSVIRRLELDALYADYAHCLDNDELEAWPEFFIEDCRYRITSAENFAAGLPIGIVYATSKGMLADRVMQRCAKPISTRPACHPAPDRRDQDRGRSRPCRGFGRALEIVANVIVVRIDAGRGDDACSLPGAMSIASQRLARRVVLLRKKDVVLDSRQIDTLLAGIPL